MTCSLYCKHKNPRFFPTLKSQGKVLHTFSQIFEECDDAGFEATTEMKIACKLIYRLFPKALPPTEYCMNINIHAKIF